MSLEDPQLSDDQVAFISTGSLVNFLHAAGYVPSAPNAFQVPLPSERAASRRSFPPPIMKILDAFAELLDIDHSRVAVACRHPSLQQGVLQFELVVCGEFSGRSALARHDNTFVRPLQLLVANGSLISPREHLEVVNYFLGQICQAGQYRKQAYLSLKLYTAAAFARPVFETLRISDVRQFLRPLQKLPSPSSLNKPFEVFNPDPLQQEYDHRLLTRLDHPRLARLLGGMDLHHLREAGTAKGQLYTKETCDEVHTLLLFLLTAYQRQICRVIRAALDGQQAMEHNQWDRKMSKKFSRTCSNLAGYGVLLHDLAGSSVLFQHLERMSNDLPIPEVNLVDTTHLPRRIAELCGAICQRDPVRTYIAWIMMQVGHLEQLSFISGLLGPVNSRIQNAGHPPPQISITSLISLPHSRHAPSLANHHDWRTVISNSLVPDPGEEGHVSAEDAISLLEEIIDAGGFEGEPVCVRDPCVHPELYLGTALLQLSDDLEWWNHGFFSQRDREEAETDLLYEPRGWNKERKRYYPIGTSGGPCLGCEAALEAIKDERRPHIQLRWLSQGEPHHVPAQPCLLPQWMPHDLVRASLGKLRAHLQAALDECQDRWGESEISVESQESEGEDGPSDYPREGFLKRKRTESQSDPIIESRRARSSLP
ncbi:hypothetical protein BKA70DRAFT_1256067 [Coprinopsis sp. MPI-PUGE-AT-0042]|nr:hypothetical protein BKA70DRAFT_1256067 [Coprinopsis sp. MPI-PUGE-AT-0042]